MRGCCECPERQGQRRESWRPEPGSWGASLRRRGREQSVKEPGEVVGELAGEPRGQNPAPHEGARGWKDTATPAQSLRACFSLSAHPAEKGCFLLTCTCIPTTRPCSVHALHLQTLPSQPWAQGAHTTHSCVSLQCTNQVLQALEVGLGGLGKGFPDTGCLELALADRLRARGGPISLGP